MKVDIWSFVSTLIAMVLVVAIMPNTVHDVFSCKMNPYSLPPSELSLVEDLGQIINYDIDIGGFITTSYFCTVITEKGEYQLDGRVCKDLHSEKRLVLMEDPCRKEPIQMYKVIE